MEPYRLEDWDIPYRISVELKSNPSMLGLSPSSPEIFVALGTVMSKLHRVPIPPELRDMKPIPSLRNVIPPSPIVATPILIVLRV